MRGRREGFVVYQVVGMEIENQLYMFFSTSAENEFFQFVYFFLKVAELKTIFLAVSLYMKG